VLQHEARDLVVTWADISLSSGQASTTSCSHYRRKRVSTFSSRRRSSPITRLAWARRHYRRAANEAHEKVFGYVLKLEAERGLVKGERIGVSGSTTEANAALRPSCGATSGVETPTIDDLVRPD
jgi:hypothetical protein